ncbi:MAG: hypothetical protein JWQ20_2039 [Conexibacter sp.]|nr:hypothetical protein [Conexibacter sp.]
MPSNSLRWTHRSMTLLGLTAAATAVWAGPASAGGFINTSTAIDERGVTQGFVQAATDSSGTLRLEVIRGSAVIAAQTGTISVTLDVVPRRDDEVKLTDTDTGDVYDTIVTGLPTLDASVCGTPAVFSGRRDPDAEMDAGATIYYGTYDARNETVSGTITSQSGDRFAGTFPHALSAGWRVFISQVQDLNPDFTVYSSFSRKVGACPPAVGGGGETPTPPAPAPPTAPPALDRRPPSARLTTPTALLKPAAAYRALIAGTFTDTIVLDEPGTVEQRLYLDDGAKLPAATAAAKRKAKAKKPMVLGTGRAVTRKAGAVKVTVRLSVAGKRKLQHSKTVKLALVTTVRDLAGNVRVLPAKRFAVKRTAAASKDKK